VLFDNTQLNTDFERTSGFGRYEVHGARTDLTGELGVTEVSQSGASALAPPNVAPGSNVTLAPQPITVAKPIGGGRLVERSPWPRSS